MNSVNKKVNLTEILPLLETEEISNKPLILVNPEGALETFFTYKGTLVEVYKMNLKIMAGKSSVEEIGEQIRSIISAGLQRGAWIVFYIGSGSDFKIADFFSKLPYVNDNFFKNENFFDKSYLKSTGILKDEEDKDFFNNHGYYKILPKSKVIYLSTCKEEEIETLINNNANISFDIILVN
jgi:hypothetical protein